MRSFSIAVIVALVLLSHSVLLRAESPRTFRDCSDCPEMVSIAGGSFTMGVSASEEEREEVPSDLKGLSLPQHRVTVSGFGLAKYLVTRGEFAAFVRDTGYQTSDTCYVLHKDGEEWNAGERPGFSWRNPNFPQTDRHPVVCVSWGDAKAYAAWLSKKTGHTYRLPSEAEWEYAARGGTSTARPWGDDHAQVCASANVGDEALASVLNKPARSPCSDGHAFTAPVGEFASNAFGLHDMQGNVWQWVEDCWNKSYQGAPSDGSAWGTGQCNERVERGASWYSFPWMVRAGSRYGLDHAIRKVYLGFRVARAR